ncbi:hypothetical protein [Bradyrhizobium sp. 151]|uniref:hypothetical protein n=1 Tax=Bradyrhizobium sp. 151 TaxID=2782626 RepID=UPI001FFA9102|nr:hypothetical protein [Bradyrhizobium sp. 151]MCK1658591.1 hypothetical protein [Bradyrhizobium sp. 151]
MKESRCLTARPSVSNEALALEIKNALAHFEVSSNWLFGLAEHIAAFPDLSVEASELLEKMHKRALRGKLSVLDRKRVYEALRALRCFSRMIANEDEPLNCMDVTESVAAFEDHVAQLRSVAKRFKNC